MSSGANGPDGAGRLSGRVAVVTGAAGGLGRSFSVALAGAGAHVVGADVAAQDATAAEVDALGGRFTAVATDVTDEEACARLAAATADLGGADVLVNNAGVFPVTPFLETTLEQWRRIHGLNVEGTFLVTRALLPQMVERGWGRVVMVSSAVVWLGPPGMVAYTASKAALIGMTRGLAKELGGTGVTVNAMTPGLIRTETALTSAVGETFDHVVAQQAVPRPEEPADLSSTLLFLCDPGSDFVTGSTVNVDGGFALH